MSEKKSLVAQTDEDKSDVTADSDFSDIGKSVSVSNAYAKRSRKKYVTPTIEAINCINEQSEIS